MFCSHVQTGVQNVFPVGSNNIFFIRYIHLDGRMSCFLTNFIFCDTCWSQQVSISSCCYRKQSITQHCNSLMMECTTTKVNNPNYLESITACSCFFVACMKFRDWPRNFKEVANKSQEIRVLHYQSYFDINISWPINSIQS